jgi:hypothetical protein
VYTEEPLFLGEPNLVAERLGRIDWAFRLDDTGFLTHDIHPYPGKFIPQVPGTLIATLSARGELVFDPFGGSGTTALEAIRLGRRALSADANPLSAIIGRAKTANIDRAAAQELSAFRSSIAAQLFALPMDPLRLISEYAAHAPTIPNRAKWYADTAFGELCLIRARIARLDLEVAHSSRKWPSRGLLSKHHSRIRRHGIRACPGMSPLAKRCADICGNLVR